MVLILRSKRTIFSNPVLLSFKGGVNLRPSVSLQFQFLPPLLKNLLQAVALASQTIFPCNDGRRAVYSAILTLLLKVRCFDHVDPNTAARCIYPCSSRRSASVGCRRWLPWRPFLRRAIVLLVSTARDNLSLTLLLLPMFDLQLSI